MPDKRIAVIGAGPGGLTAAMILARRGLDVTLYEREEHVGGRNGALKLGPYTFDIGPTFLMMTPILRGMFDEAGRSLDDYCEVTTLDPMYKLCFADREVFPTADRTRMREQIGRLFPGNEAGYDRFLMREKVRFDKMYPCLQKDYSTLVSMVSRPLRDAIPHLSLGRSLFGELGRYFNDERLRAAFTFQAKYLGMSPWKCPAAFTIVPYIEHMYGIDHVTGGLSAISDAMAGVFAEHGGTLHLGRPVRHVLTEGRVARGVETDDGERYEYDAVVINADFGAAMANLFEPGVIRKWTPARLRGKVYSCSTFMLYLGLDTRYADPHHQIVFAEDYRRNVADIVRGDTISEDMSIYVRNAGITDSTLAPKGHSAVYVLVPVPNTLKSPAWTAERIAQYRSAVLARIAGRTGMKDIESHIVEEHVITPAMWERDYGLFLGATFNLGHNLRQMLYFRPRNRFEEVGRCYLVGGGTHPGSGLPTIYESGRISAGLLVDDLAAERTVVSCAAPAAAAGQ